MCLGPCAMKADMLVQNNSASRGELEYDSQGIGYQAVFSPQTEVFKPQSLTSRLSKLETGLALSQEVAVVVC